MSVFAQASLALFAATSSVNGATVTYTRTGLGSVSLTATLGRSTLVTETGTGAGIEVESDDFIVPVSGLVIASTAITPKKGDRISRVVGAQTYTYEVMSPPYKPMDTANELFRIYSKIVSAA